MTTEQIAAALRDFDTRLRTLEYRSGIIPATTFTYDELSSDGNYFEPQPPVDVETIRAAEGLGVEASELEAEVKRNSKYIDAGHFRPTTFG